MDDFRQLVRRVLGLGAAMCTIASVSFAAGPATVTVVADAARPTVHLKPADGERLMIPACRGVVWQRFDEDSGGYVPVSPRPCGVMAPGQMVPKKGKRFAVDGPVKDGDVVRAVIVVGVNCTTGRPFELAECETVVAVEASTTTVRGSGK